MTDYGSLEIKAMAGFSEVTADVYLYWGDVDRDGTVSEADLNKINSLFGKKVGDVGFDDMCDLDRDGLIKITDFVLAERNAFLTSPEYKTPYKIEKIAVGKYWVKLVHGGKAKEAQVEIKKDELTSQTFQLLTMAESMSQMMSTMFTFMMFFMVIKMMTSFMPPKEERERERGVVVV